MAVLYSTAAQNAAITAANAAADGSKRAAFLSSWQSSLGTAPRLKLYRSSVLMWEASTTGLLPISGTAFVITTATQVSIATGDIQTGSWEFRVEKNGDSTVYLGATVTETGATDVLELDDDTASAGTVTLGTITFNAPQLDSLSITEVQKSSVSTGSNVSSLTVTLSSAATALNKIIVPIAYYDGFRSWTDPDDATVTLWLDPSDFSTLWSATGGTGAITAAGQLVKRIDNKGSAGGYFTNSTGWYLRQSTTSGYYLESDGATEFVSNGAASGFIAAGAGEVIVACRPDSSSDPGNTDYWYAPSIWQADDGEAGVSFFSSTSARAFNLDGAQDAVTLTHVQGTDQLFTWQHTGGNIAAVVGFGAPAGSTASGNTTSLTNGFTIGNAYHGSYPNFTGRFYGIVARDTAFTSDERDRLQWYLHRKMIPVTATGASVPVVTDNIGNTYERVVGAVDSASKIWTGVAVCHSAKTSATAPTLTITMPAAKGYFAAAQAIEINGLMGSDSVDVSATGTNNGSAGSLNVLTAATAQANALAVAVYGLYNGDTAAGMTAPSGYTQIGATQNATSPVAMISAYKSLTATGAQSVTGTWDSGSSGGAVGAVVVFKAGTNTDTPDVGGGGGSGSSSTVNTAYLQAEMSSNHTFIMNGVPADWSWGTGPRIGVGANPTFGTVAPAAVPWFHFATETGVTTGTHNYRIAVLAIYHDEKRGGTWTNVSTTTDPDDIDGALYTNYETNASAPADKRTSNGYLEVKLPNAGGTFHGFPFGRTVIPASGSTHRAVCIKAQLTVDDSGAADDRASAEVVMVAGLDYWRSLTQGWDPAVYSNDDAFIGRGTIPSITSTPSLHFGHTMGTNATDINEYITFLTDSGRIS
jgi:hypothetical protein